MRTFGWPNALSCTTIHLPKARHAQRVTYVLHPGGRAIPASGRSLAQEGGPREGSEPIGMPGSDDDVGFGMAPPRTSGSTKHGEILRVKEGIEENGGELRRIEEELRRN